ncbi:hypothetical protein [Loktanella sp. M215]|uniref:hypothetical protein n=1 Tax=Loktanella sp. M215 TaxID=2675431 RepID=UPI001F30147A|nr:hypothetical protein [Loktanella sp. M215]MCF7701574.1 hypothetical protein [Loktanella sp. M215]
MRKTLTFLAATTAITAGIGLPAWSAMRADTPANSLSAPLTARTSEAKLILVSGNDDNDDDTAIRSRDREEDDDCEEEDGSTACSGTACSGLANPAPAGTALAKDQKTIVSRLESRDNDPTGDTTPALYVGLDGRSGLHQEHLARPAARFSSGGDRQRYGKPVVNVAALRQISTTQCSCT